MHQRAGGQVVSHRSALCLCRPQAHTARAVNTAPSRPAAASRAADAVLPARCYRRGAALSGYPALMPYLPSTINHRKRSTLPTKSSGLRGRRALLCGSIQETRRKKANIAVTPSRGTGPDRHSSASDAEGGRAGPCLAQLGALTDSGYRELTDGVRLPAQKRRREVPPPECWNDGCPGLPAAILTIADRGDYYSAVLGLSCGPT